MKTENGTDRATPETAVRSLVDFDQAGAVDSWRVVNDGVMGGRSRSEITLTDQGTALFQGTVSLENSGGFASAFSDIQPPPLEDQAGLAVRVRGDGKTYQLRVRTDERPDRVSYSHSFSTRAGAWVTVRAEWSEFVPVFRGRIVPDAPKLAPSRIRRVGFLIS
ncbi:MAG: CIA30 family protein, partial [Desulfohalobiaceae bacterium]